MNDSSLEINTFHDQTVVLLAEKKGGVGKVQATNRTCTKCSPSTETFPGTSLVAQWIRLHALNAGGPGSISGQGTRSHMYATTKSSHATTKEPTCRN